MSLKQNKNYKSRLEELGSDSKEIYAKGQGMTAAEARRIYQREWRRKNPEKVKAIQQRYWMKKAAAAAVGGAE